MHSTTDRREKFPQGRPVYVIPAHEESPGWLALVADWTDENHVLVIPIEGHSDALTLRSIDLSQGANGPGLSVAPWSAVLRALRPFNRAAQVAVRDSVASRTFDAGAEGV